MSDVHDDEISTAQKIILALVEQHIDPRVIAMLHQNMPVFAHAIAAALCQAGDEERVCPQCSSSYMRFKIDMRQEINALKAECDRQHKAAHHWMAEANQEHNENEKLKAELDAAKEGKK